MRKKYGSIYFVSLVTLGLLFILLAGMAQADESLNQAFLKAIYAKDFSRMDQLIKKGVDINAPVREDLPPLAEAASLGDLNVVDYLLKNGAKVEGTTTKPHLPIFFAIFKGNTEIVKRFLDLGISPNYAWPERNSGTLLIQAVQFGHLDVVQLLVQRGADVNFTGNSVYSPLYRSNIYDRYDIFKFLLSKGACLSERDKAALSEVKWEKIEKDKKYIQLLDKNQRCKKK